MRERKRERKDKITNRLVRERARCFLNLLLKCKVRERHKDNSVKLTKFERGKSDRSS